MKTEELSGILQLELERTESFIALLKREQLALINGDIEALTLLGAEKISIVDQLMLLHEERSQLLTDSDASVKTMEFDVPLSSDQISAAGIAQKCQTLLQSAKQLNQTNETILSQWLRQTRQSLQALRGAVGRAELYNPKGLTV